jgi:probable HAF family extracellular repeat protein
MRIERSNKPLTVKWLRKSRFDIRPLDTLGGDVSWAHGINNKGQVVGYIRIPPAKHRAFLWEEGQMELLDLPEGFDSASARSINEAGIVVGSGRGPGMVFSQALKWDKDSVERIGRAAPEGHSHAVDINDRGMIIGDAKWNGSHAAMYGLGKWKRLGAVPEVYASTASAMNNHDQVVGWAQSSSFGTQACLYEADSLGALVDPNNLPHESCARDINDTGVAVGHTRYGEHHEATMFFCDHIEILNVPTRYECWGIGINNNNAVLINCWVSAGQGSGPMQDFLYREGLLQDLEKLYVRRAAWRIFEAKAMNDHLQIVGNGYHQGKSQAFLMEPRS